MPTKLELDRSWCRGTLKGDPDIAGVGVVSSIFATTGLAVVFSWVLWYRVRFRAPSPSSSSPSQSTTTTTTAQDRLLRCAFGIADIQLVTALAIVCSSIVLVHSASDTSLYHLFVARMLAQTNANGHGAVLLFDQRRQANWKLRLCLLAAYEALYVYLTAVTIAEFDGWEDATPRCFHNYSFYDAFAELEYTTWMRVDVAWMLAGSVWLLLEATGRFGRQLRAFDDFTVGLATRGAAGLLWDSPASLLEGRVLLAFETLVSSLARLVAYLAVLLFVTPPSTVPFASTFLVAWNFYDVYTVRDANSDIMVAFPDGPAGASSLHVSLQGNENPERDLGFGQLLPLFLLILVALQMADSFVDEKDTEPAAAVSHQVRTTMEQHNIGLAQAEHGKDFREGEVMPRRRNTERVVPGK